jgi:hypothetical protein
MKGIVAKRKADSGILGKQTADVSAQEVNV